MTARRIKIEGQILTVTRETGGRARREARTFTTSLGVLSCIGGFWTLTNNGAHTPVTNIQFSGVRA